MTRRQGFTLVELMIVMIVGIILAGVVLPAVNTLDDQWVAKDARILASDLEFAQARAIATGQNHRVLFNLAQGRYQVESPPGVILDEPLAKKPWVRNLMDPQGRGTAIARALFDGAQAVIFDAAGRPNSGGSVILVAGEFKAQVDVKAVTGEVAVTLP